VAEPKTAALVKSLEGLVAEKQAVTSKEKELVDGLNAVLSSGSGKLRGEPAGARSHRSVVGRQEACHPAQE
jgi:hypothetical protein